MCFLYYHEVTSIVIEFTFEQKPFTYVDHVFYETEALNFLIVSKN